MMTYSEELSVLIQKLREQSEGGPGVEPQTAAMFGAVIIAHEAEMHAVDTDARPITELLNDTATEQIGVRNKNPAAAVTVLRTSLVHFFRRDSIEKNQPTFTDAKLWTPDHWQPGMDILSSALTENLSNAVTSLRANIIIRHGSTTVKERTAVLEMVAQLVGKNRFPAGMRGLDIGSGLMLSPIQHMNRGRFPLRMNYLGYREHGGRAQKLTKMVNTILQQETVFTEFVANDSAIIYHTHDHGSDRKIRKQYDRGSVEFAAAGFRPSERNDPHYMQMVQSMLDTKQLGAWGYDEHERVKFAWGNLLDDNELEDFIDEFAGTFDFISHSFLWQELSEDLQVKLHEVDKRLISPNGVIVHLHQAHLGEHGDGPAPKEAITSYTDYATKPNRSQLQIIDTANPHASDKVQRVATLRDNRCQVGTMGNATLWLNDEAVRFVDLIKDFDTDTANDVENNKQAVWPHNL
jgi:hypothetical protein